MYNGITIFLAKEKDAGLIAKLETQCFSQPWSEKAVIDFLDQPINYAFCANVRDEFAGYVTFTKIFDEIQISNVAVAPEFRRQNVATILLEELKKFALKNNVEIITLEVRASNIGAIRLYEKCGYLRDGLRRAFYKFPVEDAVLMSIKPD